MPDLTAAFKNGTADKTILVDTIIQVLRVVVGELTESTESKLDIAERMANVRRVLLYFSLEELRALGEQIKSEGSIAWYGRSWSSGLSIGH